MPSLQDVTHLSQLGSPYKNIHGAPCSSFNSRSCYMSIHRGSTGGSALQGPPRPEGTLAGLEPPICHVAEEKPRPHTERLKLPPGSDTSLLTFHWPEHVTWPGLLQEGRKYPRPQEGKQPMAGIPSYFSLTPSPSTVSDKA